MEETTSLYTLYIIHAGQNHPMRTHSSRTSIQYKTRDWRKTNRFLFTQMTSLHVHVSAHHCTHSNTSSGTWMSPI